MAANFESSEKRIAHSLHDNPKDSRPLMNELHNMQHHESQAAFKKDLGRMNDELHKQGLLPGLQITENAKSHKLGVQSADAAAAHAAGAPPHAGDSAPAGRGHGPSNGGGGGEGHGHHHHHHKHHHHGKHHGHGSLGSQGSDSQDQTSDSRRPDSDSTSARRGRGDSGSETPQEKIADKGDHYGTEREGTPSQRREMAKLVAGVAAEMGMNKHDTLAAVASMLHESGGNPTDRGDKNRRGEYTSFGLFQLHKGGELTEAHLTPQQAFDPKTNARVALSYFKNLSGRYGDPGQLAAAAQRPKNPGAYAHAVDRLIPEAKALLGW